MVGPGLSFKLFHLGSYLCLSGALTDCFLPLFVCGLTAMHDHVQMV